MLSVGIFMFDEVEILDAVGPFEVFTVARRLGERHARAARAPFEVVTVAHQDRVRTRHGLCLIPHRRGCADDRFDVLLVPGGRVAAVLLDHAAMAWLTSVAARCALVASVCTGSFILAQAGLLDGLTATTHWQDIDEFRGRFPRVHVVTNRRWTENRRIWTSAGISAGIDMSLRIVAKLAGMELAQRTAHQMEYRWRPACEPPEPCRLDADS